MSVKARQNIEWRIARRIVRDALAAGYTISVNDGEETTLECSSSERAIMAALMTTDEDRLLIHRAGEAERFGWVHLVYGNDGYDVVNDYTTNLKTIMEGAIALAKSLA